jgi:hypothetical protein
VDELNSITEEKNKELEKLKQNPVLPTQNKQSGASEGSDREELVKETESLKV